MKKFKIGYHVNEINYRGLFKAAIDYVRYNKSMFGHEGFVIAPDNRSGRENHYLGKEMMKQNGIDHITYPSGGGGEPTGFYPHVDRILKDRGCDLLYIVKSGGCPDDRVSKIVPTLSHGWRGTPFERKAGPCAGMSRAAAQNGKGPLVPTIVEPNTVKEDYRSEFEIAKNDVVFGNIGGSGVFHLKVCMVAIERVLKERNDVWFTFMGIQPWKWGFKHPHLLWHKPTVDDHKRYKYINTCDAMIHARKQGEMGGGAVAEFSISNKPVITATAGKGGHRMYLREKYAKIFGIDNEQKTRVYDKQEDCYRMMTNLITRRDWFRKQDWNCYADERYPEPAMKAFREVFLKPFGG